MLRSVYHSAGEREAEEFRIKARSYKQQYANLYWLRLVALRKLLLSTAHSKWSSLSPPPLYVARVLDVTPKTLSYIVGTVYMDMTLKPNILADLAREHYIAPPPPRRKFCHPSDEIMLEDESGRVRLIGDLVQSGMGKFVTGTIMAVLGAENKAGDFEVLDICFPGLAPQPALPPLPPLPLSAPSTSTSAAASKDKDVAMNGENEEDEGEWIALLSGLEMGDHTDAADLRIQLMAEWLVGELGDEDDVRESMKITRVILVGNSLKQPEVKEEAAIKKPKIYGYDSTLHSSLPTTSLDALLAKLLPTLTIELLPGSSDPTGPTMPQQALHEALLPSAYSYSARKDAAMLAEEERERGEREEREKKGKKSEILQREKVGKGKGKGVEVVGEKGREGEGWNRRTNPFWGRCGDSSIFATSGQTLDDIFKYLNSEDRLGMAEMTLEWSHIAPTCPDTLWCYPFATHDPFILHQLPHIYIIGNQPTFSTKLITSTNFSPDLPHNPSFDSSSNLSKRKAIAVGDSDDDMIIIDESANSKSKSKEKGKENGKEGEGEKKCRIILLEKFCEGGKLVLVNSKTLEVRSVDFGI